jgi:DNA-binding beta-propeller fold protein YncE
MEGDFHEGVLMRRFLNLALVVASLGLTARAAGAAERVVLVAGGGTGSEGSPAVEAKLLSPFGVEHDAQGRLLIVEFSSRLQAIDRQGKLISIAGDGSKGDAGDGGPAARAKVNSPHAIAVGADGAIYVADTLNHRIKRIDPTTSVITTFAGTTKGYSGDGGPAARAQFSGIYCISFNPAKDKMVVTDLDNRRVRLIDMKSGLVNAIAGNGEKGVPKDGAEAARSPLVDPRAATMDSKGYVYILERGGNALRVVDPAGKIKTLVAGPKDAKVLKVLSGPKHLCVDRDDNVIIADTDNHRIVKWLAADGQLAVIAGTGVKGTVGVGGSPEQLQLNQPHGVYLDRDGVLYICDSMNNRVVRIEK